jgi:hypothetical protein
MEQTKKKSEISLDLAEKEVWVCQEEWPRCGGVFVSVSKSGSISVRERVLEMMHGSPLV